MGRNGFKYNNHNKQYGRENRKLPTKSESLVWNMILRDKNLGYRFLRQKLIGNYIVDFYCASLGLVIEIDGETHNYKYEEDRKREEYLKSLGLKVIRYTDNQVLKNLEGVFEDLKYQISLIQQKTHLTSQ